MSILITLVGLALLGGGIYSAIRKRARIRRSITTSGTVMDVLHVRARQGIVERTAEGVRFRPKYLYRPVVAFRTEKGRTVKFTASVASRPLKYREGDEVPLVYPPDEPDKAQIKGALYLWFPEAMLIGFGAFAIFMGLLGIWLG